MSCARGSPESETSFVLFFNKGSWPLDPAFLALSPAAPGCGGAPAAASTLPGPDALQGALRARCPGRRTLMQRLSAAAAAAEAAQVAHVHKGAASGRAAGGLQGRGRRRGPAAPAAAEFP